MLTMEKVTAAAQALPAEFSLGQLVDRLLASSEQSMGHELAASSATPTVLPAGHLPVDSIQALRGIAVGLSFEDMNKSAKEWEAERLQEKYKL